MKIIKLTILILFSCCLNTYAQNVKSQTEELANIKIGLYTAYLTHKDGDKYIGGFNDLHHELTEIKEYRYNPGEHREVYFYYNENPTYPNEWIAAMLVPDNEAFPATYVSSSYQGNKQLMEEIGITIRKTEDYGKTRVVFLGGKIYYITDWVDKDNYTLEAVLEHTEKPLKGLKLARELLRTPKKMSAEQPDATLQNYLDQAFAKQEEAHAAWMQNPENVAFVAEKERMVQAMIDYINEDKRAYYQSEEYRRIQENNRMADERAKTSNVTVVNNTSQNIYISGSNSGGWIRISPNSSTSYGCDYDIYYNYEGKGDGIKFYAANSSCGGTVNVQ